MFCKWKTMLVKEGRCNPAWFTLSLNQPPQGGRGQVSQWAICFFSSAKEVPSHLASLDLSFSTSWNHSFITYLTHPTRNWFSLPFSTIQWSFPAIILTPRLIWLMIFLLSFTPAQFRAAKCFSSSAPQPFHMEGQSEVEQYTIRYNWNASTCRTEMSQKLELRAAQQANCCIEITWKGVFAIVYSTEKTV